MHARPDQHHEADLREDVDVHAPRQITPTTEHSRHIGTTRMTASGSDQLSYCAASTRNTSTTASRKTNMAVLPAWSCSRASSVHSVRIDGGNGRRDGRAPCCSMASPELTPGADVPLIAAAGYML